MIEELVARADRALSNAIGQCPPALRPLLGRRNGFYVWDGALLVRPTSDVGPLQGLTSWNLRDGWKSAYCDVVDLTAWTCFAEDIFGMQFMLRDKRVAVFDPETAAIEDVAVGLEDWAAWILGDPAVNAGSPLAREWAAARGALSPGHRLIPRVPFFLGGTYDLANLIVAEEERAMRIRAGIACATRTVSDGELVRFRAVGEGDAVDYERGS